MIEAKDPQRVGSASNYSKELQATLLQIQRQIVSLRDSVPVGTAVNWMGQPDTVPDGWLFCDGRDVSRKKYNRLFKAIGTSSGVGDGETTFNLPDLRSKIPMGVAKDVSPDAITGQPVSLAYDNTDEDATLAFVYVTPIIKTGE